MDALARAREAGLEREGLERLAIGGGVAANSQLRERMRELCDSLGVRLWVPPRELCTDNAAMIGAAARFTRALPFPEYLDLDAAARLMTRVTLYGKAGCCLCDEAREVVASVRESGAFRPRGGGHLASIPCCTAATASGFRWWP